MKWTKAMGTLFLGCAFLLSGEASRAEAQKAPPCNLLSDPGLEFYPCQYKNCSPPGPSKWTAIPSGDVIGPWGDPYMGSQYAWLNGYGTESTNVLTQFVTIPSNASQATLSFRLKITTDQPSGTPDTLQVLIRNSYGVTLLPLKTYSNQDAIAFREYTPVSLQFDATPFRRQQVQIYFLGHEDGHYQTSFLIDNVGLCIPVPFP